MGFFDRNRKNLERRGIDPARLPAGQYATERFPVLHEGRVPAYGDLAGWTLRVFGQVERELTLSWPEILELPTTELTVDIHCVTKWSKFDTAWKGVSLRTVLDLAGVRPEARYVLQHAEFGYTTNVPLTDVVDRPALLAYEYDDRPLAPEHGYPLRFFVPHLYFWKSAKWLRGIELLAEDQAGFWERHGYHNYGDPFREQRYS